MKYFRELSQEDKDRAIRKLLYKPRISFTTLFRANFATLAPLEKNGNPEIPVSLPASVTKVFWYCDVLYCDVVFDHDCNTISTGHRVDSAMPCSTPMPEPKHVSTLDTDIAFKALTQLLNSGEHYVFDDKCNAFPV